MLFDENKQKIKSLQVGNPKKLSLEFNMIEMIYQIVYQLMKAKTQISLSIISINYELLNFHISKTQDFNSFHVIWKDLENRTHKEPLNPYSITFKQGIEHVKHKLQMRDHFIFGRDELIILECEFDKWKPSISSKISNMGDRVILLHNIYKHLRHYPIIQVYWEIKGYFMVPYEHTVDIERDNLPKSKQSFNPLLYECDLHKLKIIKDKIHAKITRNNLLQKLFHEVIKNDFLYDLITSQCTNNEKEKKQLYERIKRQINYNEKNPNELILNDKILTILNELKLLYHDNVHKHMGYPLQLYHICAILLYCGKSCNSEFSYDQIKFRHHKWPYLDKILQDAIMILHSHERREETEMELYCGLKGVRLENIKEIKSGFFISHVSTSDDFEIAQIFRSDQGCILHFHPSMRRVFGIESCDVSWISPFKHEREILFARSIIDSVADEKTHQQLDSWSAKVESEDKYT
ncbi:hypothetical protein RFI_01403 [Reticulomyxa filosa]|uniref:Uncharacterized protein n=1 Tax=Reticulomyxa filosa TaxID=46433 RepID=X6PC23_RETFI|nr:hypothetical protein RFI_01403 [Reticulomyxa filosa]|eukprot:ETO35658.1 hypothetical protein RFI_01403 [Reticulomyxa filosa]